MGLSRNRGGLLCFLLLVVAFFACLCAVSEAHRPHRLRKLLVLEDSEVEDDEVVVIKKKKKSEPEGDTSDKPVKPSSKLVKPDSGSLKNETKSAKSTADLLSGKAEGNGGSSLEKAKLKKLNSTSKGKASKSTSDLSASKVDGDGYSSGKSKLKKLDSTSIESSSSSSDSMFSKKKSSDLMKTSSSSKNKTSKASTDDKSKSTTSKISKKKESNEDAIKDDKKTSAATQNKNSEQNQSQKKKSPTPTITTSSKKQQTPKQTPQNRFTYDLNGDDFISDFRDLPARFHETFIPDLQRISSSSKIYFSNANKEITKGFKPYVGNKYAPAAATAISCAFIIIPFLLVSLLFHHIKAFFSIQKLLIFVQVYLAIYFTILSLSSIITGLEPLKFFYSSSQSTYVWLQVLQTLGYVLYLLLLLMYLVLVFSTDSGLGSKFVGLAQTFVGFSVGLHYYITVFHRVVLRQPPKTNWKVHAVYATCFVVICLLARADRRKKAYMGDGGEEGKKS